MSVLWGGYHRTPSHRRSGPLWSLSRLKPPKLDKPGIEGRIFLFYLMKYHRPLTAKTSSAMGIVPLSTSCIGKPDEGSIVIIFTSHFRITCGE